MRMLRPYQQAAVEAVIREWEGGIRATMIVLPTGCGKTVTAAEIIKRRRTMGRILWVAHTTELVQQAAETIAQHTGLRVGIEQAQSTANLHGLWGMSDDVIVASRQTLTASRMASRNMSPDLVATIVIDECHHATAKQYREILDHFSAARVLGLTATPIRGDEVGLAAVFDTCASRYEIRTAIAEGHLVPIRQLTIECAGIDLRDVKSVRGDLSPTQLAQIMELEENLHAIARPLVTEATDRPTIVFLPSVDASHEFARVLGSYTRERIEVVSGESTPDQRKTAIDGFRSGAVRYLVNCMVLTEGFDAPRCACIAVARPTKSTSLYTQMIGRGLRPSPDTGKSDCLVLDFVGQAGRHKLVTPLDVLSGEDLPADVRADVEREQRNGMSLDEALTKAEEAAKEREERKRARAEREARVRAEVAYKARVVSPFGEGGAMSYRRPNDPIEWASGDLLARAQAALGKRAPKQMLVNEAHRALKDKQHRFMARQCTIPMGEVLSGKGLNPRLPMVEARIAMDAIAANNWHVTPAMVERWGRK